MASSKKNLECRVVTAGTTTQCNPYSNKLLIAKEIAYHKDKKKLIISKTLPVPKKSSVKVISVMNNMSMWKSRSVMRGVKTIN